MHRRAMPHGMRTSERDLEAGGSSLDGLASPEGALTFLSGDEVGSAVVLSPTELSPLSLGFF